MTTPQPVYLDLDAVVSPAVFVVKFKGKEHQVAESSVKDFITTAREVEKVSLKQSVEADFELSLSIIQRCLPTIPKEDLETLTILQLNAMRDYVMVANGEKAEAAPATGEGAQGNVPAAS